MFIQTLNFNETHKFPKEMITNGKLEEIHHLHYQCDSVTVGICDSVTRLCLTFCSILEIIFTKYLVFS